MKRKAVPQSDSLHHYAVHVFGRQAQALCGSMLRCIGLVRAQAVLGMRNLVYNMDRYAHLVS